MGFRTVIVNSRCKLEFRLNYLIIRGEQERRIIVNEINTMIIQSTSISLTSALLCELMKNNVKVIFCDEKNNPQSELIPYYGAHNTSKRYKTQLMWREDTKRSVWRAIIKQKIENQANNLLKYGFLSEYEILNNYKNDVQYGDISNREGHAAKVYFNCMMPSGENRRSGGFINGCLNYGYAILLSIFNREIVACGYLTQLGIWHDNEFNPFNLSCDLMEPLRPVIDFTPFSLEFGDEAFKKKMVNILNYQTVINDKKTTLDIAIRQYVHSVMGAMEKNDESFICFPEVIVFNE